MILFTFIFLREIFSFFEVGLFPHKPPVEYSSEIGDGVVRTGKRKFCESAVKMSMNPVLDNEGNQKNIPMRFPRLIPCKKRRGEMGLLKVKKEQLSTMDGYTVNRRGLGRKK